MLEAIDFMKPLFPMLFYLAKLLFDSEKKPKSVFNCEVSRIQKREDG